MTGVIIRILLRVLAGFMVGRGVPPWLVDAVANDPAVLADLVGWADSVRWGDVISGGVIWAGTEVYYGFAKKLGWRT